MRGGVALHGDVCVARLGYFLPHGAILQGGGDTRVNKLVAAA